VTFILQLLQAVDHKSGSYEQREFRMKSSLIVAAGLLTVALASTVSTTSASAHNGFHSTCQLGERGWHYNTQRSGRVECRPRRPVGFGWGWREEGGRRGWYRERDRRWH
jgi:hypothetical protein